MKNGLAYVHQFKNIEGKTVTTYIYDTLVQVPDDNDVTLYSIDPAGSPLTLSTVDNNEDKFTQVKSKQLTIRFNSDANFNRITFSDGADNRFYVTCDIDSQIIFKGYLSLDDITEAFLPPKNVVVLVATDKIGSLKDIPLTEDDGENVTGKYPIGELIALCLKKTGLSLPINVINNIRHGSGQLTSAANFFAPGSGNKITLPNTTFFYVGQTFTVTGTASNNKTFIVQSLTVVGTDIDVFVDTTVVAEAALAAVFTDSSSGLHFYAGVYLDAKTFEEQIGESEDCYTCLEKILGEDCFITQFKGEWWIVRVDELDSNPLYKASFDEDGIFGQIDGIVNLDKEIGFNESLYFSEESTNVVSQRPHGFVRETYRFEVPEEIICNEIFERGDLTATISANEKHYDVDCWRGYRDNFPTSDVIAPTTDIYIRRDFVNDYETARYVVIEQSGTPASNLIMSDPIDMGLKDKFNLTVSRRLSADQGGSGSFTDIVARVRLYGDDGTFYTLHGGTITDAIPRWVACTSTFTTNQQAIQYQGDASEDQRDTVSKTVEAPPIPVAGYIRILLYQSGLWGDVADTYIEPPELEYLAFINGTYQRYTGQYNRIDLTETQGSGVKTSGYLAARDEQVYISDSPKKLFKGAMFITKKSTLLYNGSIQFAAPDTFVLSGDQTATYTPDTYLFIDSTTHEGLVKVISSTYNIIGGTTAIVISGLSIITITESGTIHLMAFVLTSRFYSAQPFALGYPPDTTYLHPYGTLQVFCVFNQYRNANRVFQYTFQGHNTLIGFGTVPPDLPNKYSITDSSPDSDFRTFMLLRFDHDLFLCESSGTLAETYRSDLGKLYGDVFEFKYTAD